MWRTLASVLCLVACKQTCDATLHCGLFLQPSGFCMAWFLSLNCDDSLHRPPWNVYFCILFGITDNGTGDQDVTDS